MIVTVTTKLPIRFTSPFPSISILIIIDSINYPITSIDNFKTISVNYILSRSIKSISR